MDVRKATRMTMVVVVLALASALPTVAKAAVGPSSAQISDWVRRALREDPRVYAADLRVSTDDGVVSISGTVWNLSEKKYALLEAKKIRGVRAVIDLIEVMPLTRPDSEIRTDIERRLATDPAVDAGGIQVAVDQAVASLKGTVDSYSEKQEAGVVAGEVLGLRRLENLLVIHWETSRSDVEIERDVRAALKRDVYLTDQPVRSSAHDGVVRLEGDVGTVYQKLRASEQAWVDNVIAVENELKIRPDLGQHVRELPPVPTDAEIESVVKSVLARDLRLEDPFRVDVSVDVGTVTLSGVVQSRTERQIADRDARNVVGVAWVSNLLMVNPERRADVEIQDDVRFNLESDWALAGQDIGVRAVRGVVTLTGFVSTPFEKAHATDVAGRVAGVRRVANALDVRPGDFYSDLSIKTRVRDRLEGDWLTSWRNPEITVEVHDGEVTLTGTVDTWVERIEAERVAAGTDGVRRVVNDLAVSGVAYPWGAAEAGGSHVARDRIDDLLHWDVFDLAL